LQVTGGLEPIAVKVSGGHFLQPVQTLVATIICSHWEQMHIESNRGRQKSRSRKWAGFYFLPFHSSLRNFCTGFLGSKK